MCFRCVLRRLPPPRMKAIAARMPNHMAARSRQACVSVIEYAAIRTNPPGAVMISGAVRCMPSGSSCEHRPQEKVDDRPDARRSGELRGRDGGDAQDDERRDEKL